MIVILCLLISGVVAVGEQRVPLGLDLYVPFPADHPPSAENIVLGRRLFFDRRLSRDGTVSCASCHDPARAFTDGRAVAVGIEGRVGRRNSPPLINLAYATRLFWDGRATTLEEQVTMPIEDPNEMDSSVASAARRAGVSPRQLSDALATYVRSILSADSRVDRFVAGDRAALSRDEQAGLTVFRGKANCTACHVGPTFSDNALHNTGVAWTGKEFSDAGGGEGKFKTPTLREISRTAPYMHDGSIATLEDVIDYYDRGARPHPSLDGEIRPLRLTEEEKRQLRSFLEALAGRTVERGVEVAGIISADR